MSDLRPHPALGGVEQSRQDDQEDDDPEAGALAHIELRLRHPHQESRHVLRILFLRGRSAVGIIDLPVGERRRHGDPSAGHEVVVVLAGVELPPGRRIAVAGHQRRDVVRPAFLVGHERQRVEDESRERIVDVARLGEHGHVRRQAAAIGGARRIGVGERRRPVIGGAAGTLEHVARVVRTVLDLVFGCERLDLPFRETWSARLREVAEGEQVRGMAVRADLAEHLEAPLQLRRVVFSEHAGERPVLPRRHGRFM